MYLTCFYQQDFRLSCQSFLTYLSRYSSISDGSMFLSSWSGPKLRSFSLDCHIHSLLASSCTCIQCRAAWLSRKSHISPGRVLRRVLTTVVLDQLSGWILLPAGSALLTVDVRVLSKAAFTVMKNHSESELHAQTHSPALAVLDTAGCEYFKSVLHVSLHVHACRHHATMQLELSVYNFSAKTPGSWRDSLRLQRENDSEEEESSAGCSKSKRAWGNPLINNSNCYNYTHLSQRKREKERERHNVYYGIVKY